MFFLIKFEHQKNRDKWYRSHDEDIFLNEKCYDKNNSIRSKTNANAIFISDNHIFLSLANEKSVFVDKTRVPGLTTIQPDRHYTSNSSFRTNQIRNGRPLIKKNYLFLFNRLELIATHNETNLFHTVNLDESDKCHSRIIRNLS